VGQLLRVRKFTVSRDGFGAGEGQSLERPFGHPDPGDDVRLGRGDGELPNRTEPGGPRGLDDYFTRDFTRDFAPASAPRSWGRNKFGPQRGPRQDDEWIGWWGGEPPFHTPAFVPTHHPRPRSRCRTPPLTSSAVSRPGAQPEQRGGAPPVLALSTEFVHSAAPQRSYDATDM